jgi:predicted RNase H-like HicB family nuclease
MERTYTFVFDPDPDGGYVVTCPALPGLVTWGAAIEDARAMALDAMEGYIEVLMEDGEAVPDTDSPDGAHPRLERRSFATEDLDDRRVDAISRTSMNLRHAPLNGMLDIA